MSEARERAWRPTRTSTALALTVTVGALAVVLQQVPAVVAPVVVGGAGALCLAGGLWLVAGDPGPLGALGAGVLSVLAGAGVVGGGYAAALLLVETVFPVEETALISLGSLVVVSHVGVVAGCFLAVLGASLGVRNTGEEALERYTRVAFATGLVPVVVGLSLLVLARLSGITPGVAVSRLATAPVSTVLVPGPVYPYLGFAVVCLAVTAVVHGTGVAGRLASSTRAALAGGAVTAAFAVAVAPLLYRRVVEETVRRFPTEVAIRIRDATLGSAATFGESTLSLLVAGVFVGFTAWLLFVLRFALGRGYLSDGSIGFSLAGVGLFIATVFASALGTPSSLVFAGIAASLVVWDTGEFGSTLGREVGRGARTRGTELVHAGAVLAVAVVGVGLATVTESVVSGTAGRSPSLLALLSVVFGLLLLVVSLR